MTLPDDELIESRLRRYRLAAPPAGWPRTAPPVASDQRWPGWGWTVAALLLFGLTLRGATSLLDRNGNGRWPDPGPGENAAIAADLLGAEAGARYAAWNAAALRHRRALDLRERMPFHE